MPSADPELVKIIEVYSGKECHGDLEQYCITYLKRQGYKEERFSWHPKAGVKNYEDMTRQEFDCMMYLCHEWDWGGLIK